MKYAIIGNGVAGVTAAFTLRRRDPSAQIALVSGESDYFFSRTALMYAYMDRLDLRGLEPHERAVYKAQRIDRVRGWARDIDADEKLIRFEDGKTLEYDRLLIASGSTPNALTWPGLDRVQSGLVNFVSLGDLALCEKLTPSTRHALVVGGGLIGVELVECLRHHGVEVDFLVREASYWPAALSLAEGALVAEEIERHGVRLRLGEEVADVQNNGGRVESVRTTKGGQIECQMLGVAIGVRPAVDWLRGVKTPPALGRGIQVTPDFLTSLPNVWAAGDCAEHQQTVEQLWYAAKRQGELTARAMLGDTVSYSPPLFYNSAKFFEMEFTTVGRAVHLPPDALVFEHRVPGRRASVRIASRQGAVIGFNMLGARWNHQLFETWVKELRSLDYTIEHLHQAQFDVEFGRLPLATVLAAWHERRAT